MDGKRHGEGRGNNEKLQLLTYRYVNQCFIDVFCLGGGSDFKHGEGCAAAKKTGVKLCFTGRTTEKKAAIAAFSMTKQIDCATLFFPLWMLWMPW